MTATNSSIIIDPEIMVGKPVIKGTRLTVEFIVGLLGNGWSQEARPAQFPTREEGL
jgi:uncharacterized protein (DUF433 family)